MDRNLSQYSRQLLPLSWSCLFSYRYSFPDVKGTFAAYTRKKIYPNSQPTPVKSASRSLFRHLDTEVTYCLSNRQFDTLWSSDLHEDPLQLQWCFSWWHWLRQQHLQSREYPERPYGCQSFWQRSESWSFLQRIENRQVSVRNKSSQLRGLIYWAFWGQNPLQWKRWSLRQISAYGELGYKSFKESFHITQYFQVENECTHGRVTSGTTWGTGIRSQFSCCLSECTMAWSQEPSTILKKRVNRRSVYRSIKGYNTL